MKWKWVKMFCSLSRACCSGQVRSILTAASCWELSERWGAFCPAAMSPWRKTWGGKKEKELGKGQGIMRNINWLTFLSIHTQVDASYIRLDVDFFFLSHIQRLKCAFHLGMINSCSDEAPGGSSANCCRRSQQTRESRQESAAQRSVSPSAGLRQYTFTCKNDAAWSERDLFACFCSLIYSNASRHPFISLQILKSSGFFYPCEVIKAGAD